jgi:cytochrome P450
MEKTEISTIGINQLGGPPALPWVGNLHQLKPARLHRIIQKWSEEYGPIFKLNLGTAPVVVMTDPEAIQYVLKSRPEKFRRSAMMDEVMQEMSIHGVFNAEGEDWKNQRKLVSQALNLNHVKSFFPALVGITNKLLQRWRKYSDSNSDVEIKSELMRYTVDITSNLAFGYDMNTLEKEHDIIQDHLEVIFPALFKRINLPIPYWRYFKLPADKNLEKSLRAIHDTIKPIISETRTKLAENVHLKNNPENFLQALIASSGPGDDLSDKVLTGNVLTMMLAGEDTTAHTLTWIFYFMHLHPEVQVKMQQEADSVLKEDNTLQHYDDQARLQYIEAVAHEAMRLKPVGPLMFFDTLDDVVVEGVEIPKGTGVFLQTQYAAISEKHFSHSDRFFPERWLGNVCPVHNERAFVPFGAGPRFCPGYHLAMLEIKAILAMVCKNFVVKMVSNPEGVKEILAFTMMPSGFTIRFTNRN